uniref:non-specific serine/threonine protein kinase n=2 Tax=Fagus sylvatica TaxID=28930 RepID=A0A2N9FCL3_FAGSY
MEKLVDSLTTSQYISNGSSLVSKDGTFELGFFKPGSSKNHYLGIWYKNIPVKTVVWVANRLNPINDSSGLLMINSTGSVVLMSQNKSVVWSAGNSFWESFDYPSDTLLPGMKMGWDLRNGIKRRFTAWKNPDDPSPGDFTCGIEMQPHSYPEAYIRKGQRKVLSYCSTRERYTWIEADKVWRVYASVPRDYCDNYGLCGGNGNCILSGSPVCQCLKGFKPKLQDNWNLMDWSQGCVRNKPLSSMSCHNDGFVKFVELKLPDTTHSWMNKSMSLKECRVKCLNNCSCMAYTNSDIRGVGSGCAMWFGDLVDIRQFPAGGQDLYIRMSASEIEATKGRKTKIAVVVVVAALAVVFGMLLIGFCICRRRTNLKDLSTIASATDNFAMNNKLGEGGFGPVYKGILEDGQEIAVKRLSRSSGQGLNEFKNEVRLIAKLQHRNLVKLLACCIQGEEKMLVYEYMPNRSLDSFIFDFGMARTFGGDQLEGNTNRVVGTYGYMAPEYAFDGQFSTKSDVFSFGILLLEIISGMRSRGFYHPNHSHNLIGQAWILWNEGRPLELVDECLGNSCTLSELLRCIHLSLLCVQQRPEDRPSMSSVVVILGSESALPQPKKPGFFLEKDSNEGPGFSSKHESSSTNEITITILEAR